MQDCVVAIFSDPEQFAAGILRLEEAEVGREHISVVTRSIEREAPASADDVQTGDESGPKSRRGAAAGSLLGALAGGSLMILPGVGPLLATGAFAGALTGGIVGGFLGSMQGWGVHEDHIKRYDEALLAGEIIAVVHGNPLHLARAVRVLREQAKDVHLYAATESDSPELFEETALKRL